MYTRRIVGIKSLDNFRDMGGFVTLENYITKPKIFFRSETLLGISKQDIQYLRQIGIKNCIDLHGNLYGETQKHPIIDSYINYYCLPILSNIIQHTGTFRDKFRPDYWVKVNIDLLENNKKWINEVIRTCASTEGGTIIHCRTGKSRTSLIMMILLLVAKVPTVDIVADFSVTEIYMKNKYKKYYRNSFHSWGFYSSAAFIMEETISYLLNTYNSVENYLYSCGATNEVIKMIRQKFVVALK